VPYPTRHAVGDGAFDPSRDTALDPILHGVRSLHGFRSRRRFRGLGGLRDLGHGRSLGRAVLRHDPERHEAGENRRPGEPPPAGNTAFVIVLLKHLKSPFQVLQGRRGARGGETGLSRGHTPP
jgi:hypothetical protein